MTLHNVFKHIQFRQYLQQYTREVNYIKSLKPMDIFAY